MSTRKRVNEPATPPEPTVAETLAKATKAKATWANKVRIHQKQVGVPNIRAGMQTDSIERGGGLG